MRNHLAPALLCSAALGLMSCGSGSKPAASVGHSPNPEVARLLQAAATTALGSQTGSAHAGRLRIHVVERASGFMNAGARNGFALVVPSETRMVIAPNSSARIAARFTGRSYLASSLARRRWEAAGKPRLPVDHATSLRVATLSAGRYSFLPTGSPLTFREARRLPTSPEQVRRAVEAHLQRIGAQDRAAAVLRSFGYLLAVAPLRSKTRDAIFEAVSALPSVRLGGRGYDLLGRGGVWVVTDGSNVWTEVLLEPAHATVLAVQERVRKPQPIFPSLSVGDPIETTTFVSGS